MKYSDLKAAMAKLLETPPSFRFSPEREDGLLRLDELFGEADSEISPVLGQFYRERMDPASNILAFQSLGHNWRWQEMDQTANVLWRIWGDAGTEAGTEHTERLEQKNSLQKSVAAYLKNGGRFTEGVLIVFRNELPGLFRELEQTDTATE